MNNSHLSALQSKHAELSSRIAQEERRPARDEVLLHQLKKQKLNLKDEIVAVQVTH